jgi:hypothetical protein
MTNQPMGGPRPNIRGLVKPRQLTIGECAAIARYGPMIVESETGKVSMPDVLAFIDRIQVCTTCGWPPHIHEWDPAARGSVHCCPQWTRKI